MNDSKKTGNLGEKLALEYMVSKGFKHIISNYHSRYGEIDIIFESSENIVFVEVKARKNYNFGRGIEAVNEQKRIKIIKTAFEYLLNHPSNKQPRFDVIEVWFCTKKVIHYENAFTGDEYDAFF